MDIIVIILTAVNYSKAFAVYAMGGRACVRLPSGAKRVINFDLYALKLRFTVEIISMLSSIMVFMNRILFEFFVVG